MLCCNNSKAQSEFVDEDIMNTLEAILRIFSERKKIVKFVFGALVQLTPQTRASRAFASKITVEKLGRLIQSTLTNFSAALLIFRLRKWYLILRGLVIFLNAAYASPMDAVSISITSSFVTGTLNWGNSSKLSLACLMNICYSPIGAIVNTSHSKSVQDITNLIMNNPTDSQIHQLCLGILTNMVYASVSPPTSAVQEVLKSTGAYQLVTNMLNSFSSGDGSFKHSTLAEFQCVLILMKLLIHSKGDENELSAKFHIGFRVDATSRNLAASNQVTRITEFLENRTRSFCRKFKHRSSPQFHTYSKNRLH